jgi:hypothetical protein
MHMFMWFLYYICITYHDIVTCGPLEGILVCLCRSLTGESLNMEAHGSLDLHLGHEAHMLDDAPPLLGTTWMRDIAFGNFLLSIGGDSLSFPTPTFSFGGHTLLF